ncbi:MAG: tyrosine-type recombinase/integrase [Gammaproteobacteria bacterium]|nr:tyrosine-type recombinase/integrase [Gammaproteobacteria bacterium]
MPPSLLAIEPDPAHLFLADWGESFEPGFLGSLVKRYIDAADIGKPGSCHLFRHACATHMLEAGCDLYYIKEMLGHVNYNTTTIYTRVSLNKLAEIHRATRPSEAITDMG